MEIKDRVLYLDEQESFNKEYIQEKQAEIDYVVEIRGGAKILVWSNTNLGGEITLPDGVTEFIGEYDKTPKVEVTKLVLPDSITKDDNLGYFLLKYFPNLKEIDLSNIDDLKNLGLFSFKKLENVKFSPKIKVLPRYFLYNCGNLKHVDLPDGLYMICENAFTASGIEDLYIPDSVNDFELAQMGLHTCKNLKKLSVPIWIMNSFSSKLDTLEELIIRNAKSKISLTKITKCCPNLRYARVAENGNFVVTFSSFLFFDDNRCFMGIYRIWCRPNI